jgi:hypothetical protein
VRKHVGFILATLFFCGCATTEKFEERLNGYIGATEDKLVAEWGIPEKTYELKNGKKALEFLSKSTVYTGGYAYVTPQTSYQTGKIDGKDYSTTSTTYVVEKEPMQPRKLSCKTTFMLDANGKVESWHHDGNNCVAK